MPSPHEDDDHVREQLRRWATVQKCPDCGTIGMEVHWGLGIRPRMSCPRCEWEASTRPASS